MEKSNQNPMGTKPIASLIFTMGCPLINFYYGMSSYSFNVCAIYV